MGQFSVEKPDLPGSVLSGNQHSVRAQAKRQTFAQAQPQPSARAEAGRRTSGLVQATMIQL